MSSVYSTEGGGGLILIAVAGFGVGYVLGRTRIITRDNVTKIATVVSCAVAAVTVFAADGPNAGSLLFTFGRIAIFAIWCFPETPTVPFVQH